MLQGALFKAIEASNFSTSLNTQMTSIYRIHYTIACSFFVGKLSKIDKSFVSRDGNKSLINALLFQ